MTEIAWPLSKGKAAIDNFECSQVPDNIWGLFSECLSVSPLTPSARFFFFSCSIDFLVICFVSPGITIRENNPSLCFASAVSYVWIFKRAQHCVLWKQSKQQNNQIGVILAIKKQSSSICEQQWLTTQPNGETGCRNMHHESQMASDQVIAGCD